MNMSLWARPSLSINLRALRVVRIGCWSAIWGMMVLTLPAVAQEEGCSSAGPAQEILREGQQQEVVLAKEKSLYVVMDLSRGALELKGRGLLLKEFPFQSSAWLGELGPHVRVVSLKEKIPLIEPQPTIPSAVKEDGSVSPAEARPLVVTDMPHRYTVDWGDGLALVIQSEKIDSAWDQVFEPTAMWANRLTLRVSHWGAGVFGVPSAEVVLDMKSTHAQALYWALVSPMKMLILPTSCSEHPQE